MRPVRKGEGVGGEGYFPIFRGDAILQSISGLGYPTFEDSCIYAIHLRTFRIVGAAFTSLGVEHHELPASGGVDCGSGVCGERQHGLPEELAGGIIECPKLAVIYRCR